jgi:hypothetical protein
MVVDIQLAVEGAFLLLEPRGLRGDLVADLLFPQPATQTAGQVEQEKYQLQQVDSFMVAGEAVQRVAYRVENRFMVAGEGRRQRPELPFMVALEQQDPVQA